VKSMNICFYMFKMGGMEKILGEKILNGDSGYSQSNNILHVVGRISQKQGTVV